jgi:hypothetical protein
LKNSKWLKIHIFYDLILILFNSFFDIIFILIKWNCIFYKYI